MLFWTTWQNKMLDSASPMWLSIDAKKEDYTFQCCTNIHQQWPESWALEQSCSPPSLIPAIKLAAVLTTRRSSEVPVRAVAWYAALCARFLSRQLIIIQQILQMLHLLTEHQAFSCHLPRHSWCHAAWKRKSTSVQQQECETSDTKTAACHRANLLSYSTLCLNNKTQNWVLPMCFPSALSDWAEDSSGIALWSNKSVIPKSRGEHQSHFLDCCLFVLGLSERWHRQPMHHQFRAASASTRPAWASPAGDFFQNGQHRGARVKVWTMSIELELSLQPFKTRETLFPNKHQSLARPSWS